MSPAIALKSHNRASKPYAFRAPSVSGSILLVGEGNLSFATSLARRHFQVPSKINASVFESQSQLDLFALKNVGLLKTLGAKVSFSVDACRLRDSVQSELFELIIFQFPHVGHRSAVWGRNPNHILIRRFLRSASRQLRRKGSIAITVVDTPHYLGAFNFNQAARFAGVSIVAIHPFYPASHVGYEHVKTKGGRGALDQHSTFSTWVFAR